VQVQEQAGKARPDLKSTRELARELEKVALNGGSAARQFPSLARLQSAYVHADARHALDRMVVGCEQALDEIESLRTQQAALEQGLQETHELSSAEQSRMQLRSEALLQQQAEGALELNKSLAAMHAAQRAAAQASAEAERYKTMHGDAQAALEQARTVLARLERDWQERESECARIKAGNEIQTHEIVSLRHRLRALEAQGARQDVGAAAHGLGGDGDAALELERYREFVNELLLVPNLRENGGRLESLGTPRDGGDPTLVPPLLALARDKLLEFKRSVCVHVCVWACVCVCV